jgi:hypothetical protein
MALATDMNAPLRNVAGSYLARRNQRRLLVMCNCETFGVVNAMHNIASGIAVDAMVTHEVLGKPDAFYAELLDRYEHIFAFTLLRPQLDKPEFAGRVTYLPLVVFDAYHPDLIYVNYRGTNLEGPLGAYHSALTLGCFEHGRSVAETVAMFNAGTYRALGYMQGWETAKQRLLADFRDLGFGGLERHFYRWCAEGSFMVSIDHPRIRVLSSIAAEALRRIGVTPAHAAADIGDNMLNGPMFPVYPEIGAAYGLAGDYRFKPPGTTHILSLEEFVTLSFEVYAVLAPADVALRNTFRDKVDAAIRLCG